MHVVVVYLSVVLNGDSIVHVPFSYVSTIWLKGGLL